MDAKRRRAFENGGQVSLNDSQTVPVPFQSAVKLSPRIALMPTGVMRNQTSDCNDRSWKIRTGSVLYGHLGKLVMLPRDKNSAFGFPVYWKVHVGKLVSDGPR